MNVLTNLTVLEDMHLFANDTACRVVDETFESIFQMRNISVHRDVPSGVLVSSAMIALSLVALTIGGKVVRPVASCTAGVLSFYGCYELTENSDNISCDVRIAVSVGIAVIIGFLVSCLMKLALFIVGAASGALLVHLVFSTFPELHLIGDMPQLLDNSVLYWGCILIVGVSGGLFLRWNRKTSLEVATALIGGAGLAYGMHGLFEASNANVENVVFLGIGGGAAVIGIVFQRRFRKGCHENKRLRRQKKKQHDESV